MFKNFKKILKNKTPIIFQLVKRAYQTTIFYKKSIASLEAASKEKKERLIKLNLEYMIKVFNYSFVVHNGPFRGLRFIDEPSWGPLLPKILGSYEEPIQDWVLEAIERKYKTILNIGCAEGYYAAGFGMRMPSTEIIAYDIDEDAQIKIDKLIKLNHLKNIQIKSDCTFNELNLMCKKNTLIFCDIEGHEKILLDPNKVPNLNYVDLIVESHDCFFPNITELLISRFYKTHTIKIVVDYPLRLNKYLTPNKCSLQELNQIQNEDRPNAMKFLYMQSVDGKF